MTDWKAVARQSAINAGIKQPEIFVKQIGAESNFNPNARSPVGATGIAQIMPQTAKGWGVDPNDPHAALDAAANAMSKYLRSYKGDWRKALAAYNAGPGAVAKYNGVPPFKETKGYIAKILGGSNPRGSVATTPTSAAPADPAVSSATPGFSAVQQSALRNVFSEGRMRELVERAIVARETQAVNATRAATAPAVGAAVTSNVAGGPGRSWKSLAKWAADNYSARVQGTFQTYGGKHTDGSLHYAKRAIDLGDATVSRKQFDQIAAYAKANPGQFKEIYFDKLGWYIKNGKIIKGSIGGHGDHMHLAV